MFENPKQNKIPNFLQQTGLLSLIPISRFFPHFFLLHDFSRKDNSLPFLSNNTGR